MLTGSSDHTRGWDCVGFTFESRLVCRHDREEVVMGGEGGGGGEERKRRGRGKERKDEGGKRGVKSGGD